MEVFKTVSHYLWFSVVLSNVQNVPIIMSGIVWKKLNPGFRLFGDIFWSILTIIRVKNEIFYHLGKKKIEKSQFWAWNGHFQIRPKMVFRKSAIFANKIFQSWFFWIQRRKTKFPFRNQYRKFLFKPRFPKKSLFLILQTITDIIYWNFSHKTRKMISVVRI